MKTTNKILLITGGIVLALLIFGLIAVKISSGHLLTVQALGASESRTIALADFNGISVRSVWKVTLRQGSNYQVVISGPPKLLEQTLVEKRGSLLVLDARKPINNSLNQTLKAEIVMPNLERIDYSGVSNIEAEGLNGESLKISASGVGNLIIKESSFENAIILLTGVGNIDLSQSSCRNAEIYLSGVGNLKINMAGGSLTGSLTGVGGVEYTGEVAVQDISKTGRGKIVKK